nr:serine/threonine-protein kinase, active site protein [Tanacetum cinerariifolium]
MGKVDIDTLTMKKYFSLTKGNQAPRNKKEKYKSLAHKARKVLSEEEATSSDSNDEEYSLADDKKEIADRRCFKCGDPNNFISDCPKHFFNDQKTFVVGCWSDSEDDSKKEEICLMALDNNKDDDFKSPSWVSATNYVNAFCDRVTGCLGDVDNFLKKRKLEQVVAIVKSCSPNMLDDLNVTLKDLSDVDHIKIPLNDIIQATNNFAYESIIDKDAFGVVYKGKLSGQILAFKRYTNLQKSDFHKEVMFRSTIKHRNIIYLEGFCDEDDEMILVLEHPTKGSLYMYLSIPCLTWPMRVYICLDIARGLEYLHDDPQKIALGDLKSASIHLDNGWKTKIGLSESFVTNEQLTSFSNFSNLGYVDPLYMETGRVTKETDIYSFGVILFEVLCGRQATTKDEETGWFLSTLACHHYENGTLTEIIDPIFRLQMDQGFLNDFSALAYRCLNMDPSLRPTAPMLGLKLMSMTMKFQSFRLRPEPSIDHMRIPLSDIGLATRKAVLFHFDVERLDAENEIWEMSMEELLKYPRRKSFVFIKSLDHRSGQRTEELLRTLSYVSHGNLLKIFGFCDEDDERILVVYEYASMQPGGSNFSIMIVIGIEG